MTDEFGEIRDLMLDHLNGKLTLLEALLAALDRGIAFDKGD